LKENDLNAVENKYRDKKSREHIEIASGKTHYRAGRYACCFGYIVNNQLNSRKYFVFLVIVWLCQALYLWNNG